MDINSNFPEKTADFIEDAPFEFEEIKPESRGSIISVRNLSKSYGSKKSS